MSIAISAFDPSDLDRMEPGAVEVVRLGSDNVAPHLGWTFFEDGVPIGSIGLVQTDRWYVWGHFSDRLREWPQCYALHATVVRNMPAVIERLDALPLYASVLKGWFPGALWLKRLGFEQKEELPNYCGSGLDFVRYKLSKVPA